MCADLFASCYICCMRDRLRLFFLCLLVVSLPIQGIAGVTMVECGMSHPPAVDSSAHPGDLQTSGVLDDATHDEAHGHVAAAMQDGGESPDACDSSHQLSRCGTCTGCGIGACAPPPVVALTAVEEAVSEVQQFSLSPFTGHIPARIERPPRPS